MKNIILMTIVGLFSLNAAAQSPNDVISEAAELLDQALNERKDALGQDKEALYDLIDGILLPRFDRKYAAQQVLGKHWRSAKPEQQDRFVNAFYQSLLRKYAEGVLEFDQSKIVILPFRGDLSKPRVTVKTTVRLDDGTKVPVDYALVKRDSSWLIFDVVIEGISYIITFRSEMNNEIQRTSLDAVIERLESDATGVASGE